MPDALETTAMTQTKTTPADADPLCRVAVIGCGYVANMYAASFPRHPSIRVISTVDHIADRARAMSDRLPGRVSTYTDVSELLRQEEFDIAVNLTNPSAHAEINRACLESGRHVYTEKPLAMDVASARALADMARRRDLMLCSAPCTLLSPTAQTLWSALDDGLIGTPRLVFAEMDDGMVHRMRLAEWRNEMGVPWPADDEFRTGCTVEHAGYVLSWLAPMFGPVRELTSFAHVVVPDKLPGRRYATPDLTVACLHHASGVVTRMTNGIYAPRDHSLRVFGDEGVLKVADPRCDDSPVTLRTYISLRRGRRLSPMRRRLRLRGDKLGRTGYRGSQRRDFCRGIADMAAAIREQRSPQLSADLGLHVTEVALRIQEGGVQRIDSTLEADQLQRRTR